MSRKNKWVEEDEAKDQKSSPMIQNKTGSLEDGDAISQNIQRPTFGTFCLSILL
jgi:hypothetical protein